MSRVDQALMAHLASGATTVCRCWSVKRKDGRVLGFTDHDRDIEFGGVTFSANTGLTAEALSQSTGLSVDNTEAAGVLSASSVTEADIAAGRFDGADVEAFLVNWSDPEQRSLRFRGTIGEIRSGGGAFHAELRGLAESLNQPGGRIYQPLCGARFGDADCGMDADSSDYAAEAVVVKVLSHASLELEELAAYALRWFERGELKVLDGEAAGLTARIKSDERLGGGLSRIGLWEDLRTSIAVGDRVRIVAGCDKRLETCRNRFRNTTNFRGFPHIPGDDWLMAVPARAKRKDGGSRQ